MIVLGSSVGWGPPPPPLPPAPVLGDATVNEVLADAMSKKIGVGATLGEPDALGKLAELPEANVTRGSAVAGLTGAEDSGGGIEEPEEDPIEPDPPGKVTGGELPDAEDADPSGGMAAGSGGIDGGVDIGKAGGSEVGVIFTPGDTEALLDDTKDGPGGELELAGTSRAAPTELPEAEAEEE